MFTIKICSIFASVVKIYKCVCFYFWIKTFKIFLKLLAAGFVSFSNGWWIYLQRYSIEVSINYIKINFFRLINILYILIILTTETKMLHVFYSEHSARSRMKLNSCAHPQKRRTGRWYVCIFISLVSLFFVTPGHFPENQKGEKRRKKNLKINPGCYEIFRSSPDWPQGTFGHTGAWHWPPPPPSAKVKERKCYTSTPPLGLHGLFKGEIYLYVCLTTRKIYALKTIADFHLADISQYTGCKHYVGCAYSSGWRKPFCVGCLQNVRKSDKTKQSCWQRSNQ
jgi:hypothetical protein